MLPTGLIRRVDKSSTGSILYNSFNSCFSLVVQVPFLYNFIQLLYQSRKQMSRTIFEDHKILLDIWLEIRYNICWRKNYDRNRHSVHSSTDGKYKS